MKKYILAMTALPESKGQEMARILVEKKVCACVNIIPSVRSVYVWEGKTTTDSEVILLIKTEERLEEVLKDTIIENHPYELPEFIVVDIKSGSKDYLDWITDNLST